MNIRVVPRWNVNVYGLRSPSAQIAWFLPVVVDTKGLSDGNRPVRVDPQDLPEDGGELLRVARASVVAGGDVQLAVRAEVDRAAVVVASCAERVELEGDPSRCLRLRRRPPP